MLMTLLEYGRDFDFSRPFFEQFAELDASVPKSQLYKIQKAKTVTTQTIPPRIATAILWLERWEVKIATTVTECSILVTA